ncbi:MAG: protein kinase [Gemmatimonadales bacterium]
MTDPLPRLSAALADRYRIERELGAGGMATVYLAEDLKHRRKVAIKVLRAELAAVIGAERFVTEITTTANLQHPHILALHDSGEANGFLFYVMPYVEGESLRDRLSREKQLPIADAVRIAGEVAGALDYAHRQGVIHRDIKPENILLHDGRALVADFGIALAATSAGSRMTETGMSLGTPHYMSPEQAMGERQLDARTDVYALGCVLYEMLAGDPPFTGSTAQAIVAKVMTERPTALSTVRDTVPEEVEDAVLTSLAKLPADRFATAAEFAAALQGQGTGPMRRVRPLGPAAPLPRRLVPMLLVAAIALALWGWLRPQRAPPSSPPSRLAIPTPTLGGSSTGLQRQVAITPDGSTILYTAVAEGGNYTMARALDETEAAVVPSIPQFVAGYAISKDGREFVATSFTSRASSRFPIGGGTAKPIPADLDVNGYYAWADDGALWFGALQNMSEGTARLSQDDRITHPFGTKNADLVPMFILPGDKTAIAARKNLGTASGPAFLLDLKTGEATPLIDQNVVDIKFAAGFVVYALTNGNLEAVPFDLSTKKVTGSPVTIATGVSLTGTGVAQFDVATNGTVVYVPEDPRSLVLVDRSGAMRTAVAEGHNYHSPRFSPDGQRVAVDFTTADGRDVWLLRLADGTLTRTTFLRDGHDPTWSPDGRFLSFLSTRSGALGIYRIRPGSTEPAESLFASPQLGYTGVWLKDESAIVTAGTTLEGGSRTDIGIIRNGGRGPIDPLVATRFEEQYPAVSPDDKWLAFASSQSGREEVYVRRLDGTGEQVQISLAGGAEPVWGPNGRELFYRASNGSGVDLVMATLQVIPTVQVLSRQPLFAVSDIGTATPHANYDISPDGKTFVMVRLNPASRIMVIQNLPGLVAKLRGNTP